MPKAISSFELSLMTGRSIKPLRAGFTRNCVWPFSNGDFSLEQDCRRREILPGSMGHPAALLSACLNVCKPRGTSPARLVRVHGSVGLSRWSPLGGRIPHRPFMFVALFPTTCGPKPWIGFVAREGVRPFCMRDPAIAEFPAELWGRIAARRVRTFRSWLQTDDDECGYRPLRESIANYLGASRGVRCSSGQVIVVSGVQQALDLLARLLVKQGDPVWMEDPGHVGATIVFGDAGPNWFPCQSMSMACPSTVV
jgi:hypothetical protein